jgi:hypothetical protein
MECQFLNTLFIFPTLKLVFFLLVSLENMANKHMSKFSSMKRRKENLINIHYEIWLLLKAYI